MKKMMDTAAQIKRDIISRIESNDDIGFLKALHAFIDASEEPYRLSLEQEEAIAIGRQEIRNGKFIENDKLISELEEWMKRR